MTFSNLERFLTDQEFYLTCSLLSLPFIFLTFRCFLRSLALCRLIGIRVVVLYFDGVDCDVFL